MFRVKFGNNHTCGCWVEEFPTYTAAWVAYLSAKEIGDPKRIAVLFLA